MREHPKNASLLFAGTEFGLFVSWNAGGSWTRVRGKLPTVPVFDIQIHPRDNDLILATHGRGVYILDDLGALGQADPATLDADLRLFDVEPATAVPDLRAQGKHRAQVPGRAEPPGGSRDHVLPEGEAGREGGREDHDHRRHGRGRARDQGTEGEGPQPGELGPARASRRCLRHPPAPANPSSGRRAGRW